MYDEATVWKVYSKAADLATKAYNEVIATALSKALEGVGLLHKNSRVNTCPTTTTTNAN